MTAVTSFEKRQLWKISTSTPAPRRTCAPITIPPNGVLSFGPDDLVTITSELVYRPLCTDAAGANITSWRPAPFYGSATPQVFVVATAMVLAWVLVIMLIISPRTFYRGAGPSPFSSTRRGIITGAEGGSTSSMGIGSRPWLQKAAALTVAISLTIAVADTFKVSQQHYPAGIDGNSLRALVENSIEIRISRVVSDVFVLLAQVQTLIRVFPRHKEKVLIKWIGFALIILDITFSSLNSFLPNVNYSRPRDFADAIPALSYLFELALSLLYMAWIIYYAFTKRRYAFYNPKMKTISIIAALALVAILTPTVFFVTDITFPDIAGWGDYLRWVGAAAASVVVWEWVERIEMLEKDERKDGILGREIFEGDEMLDLSPTGEMTYHGRRTDTNFFSRGKGGSRETTTTISSILRKPGPTFGRGMFGIFGRKTKPQHEASDPKESQSESTDSSDQGRSSEEGNRVGPLPAHIDVPNIAAPVAPAPAVTPPNRADTTSAASTVYVVHHDGDHTIQPVRRRFFTPDPNPSLPSAQSPPTDETSYEATATGRGALTAGWHAVSNPFKRKRTTPPAEIRAATSGAQPVPTAPDTKASAFNKKSTFDFRTQLDGLRSRAQVRNRDRAQAKKNIDDLPWTIIPAQPRGQTWVPSPTVANSDSPPVSEGTERRDFQQTPQVSDAQDRRRSPPPDPGAAVAGPSVPAVGPRHGQSDSIDARLTSTVATPPQPPPPHDRGST